MHRPENDVDLPQLLRNVQKLSASLDVVTRERGVRGVADCLANITAATREAEWRCNDILKESPMLENPYFHNEDAKHERCYWRRVLGVIAAAVVVGIVLGFLLYPTKVKADPYVGPAMVLEDQNGNKVKLTKEPCKNSTGWLKLSTAQMRYQGKDYLACWFILGSYVIVLDSNGDASGIPVQAFKPEEGV